ncbi:hypothetical protein LINPERHAP1_LOCUS9597, partial [Linum perenne]
MMIQLLHPFASSCKFEDPIVYIDRQQVHNVLYHLQLSGLDSLCLIV